MHLVRTLVKPGAPDTGRTSGLIFLLTLWPVRLLLDMVLGSVNDCESAERPEDSKMRTKTEKQPKAGTISKRVRFACAGCGRDLGPCLEDGRGFAVNDNTACPVHGKGYRYTREVRVGQAGV